MISCSIGTYHVLKAHVHTLEKFPELAVFRHLKLITAEHSGRPHVRDLQESFKVKSSSGEHEFFIMEPLGMSLRTLQELQKTKLLPLALVKGALDQVAVGLNFLHESGVVHKGNNSRHKIRLP